MNAKLHLGVQKGLEGDSLGDDALDGASGVYARIVPAGGRGKAVQALVPIGPGGATNAIDVPAGRLNVQVRLPSGEVLSDDLEVGEGGEAKLVLRSSQSPREWLSWPRMLSPSLTAALRAAAPAAEPGAPPLELPMQLWVRDQQGSIVRPNARPWQQSMDAALDVISCTFDAQAFKDGFSNTPGAERTYLAIDVPGAAHLLATIPLPWDRQPRKREPRAQVVLKLARDSKTKQRQVRDVDVLVRDTALAPMLGYLHSGDFAAAREYEASVRQSAESALFEKGANPLAAAAGGYLLLQTRALEQMHDWPRNLATRFEWLPDGPILWATQLLRSRSRPRDGGEARKWLCEAAHRGAPVFTEGVRLLVEGMRLTATWESAESSRRRAGSDFEEATAEWIERLESATRPDSLFTVLEGDDATLQSLVGGLKT